MMVEASVVTPTFEPVRITCVCSSLAAELFGAINGDDDAGVGNVNVVDICERDDDKANDDDANDDDAADDDDDVNDDASSG
jgi:hypothetical protein